MKGRALFEEPNEPLQIRIYSIPFKERVKVIGHETVRGNCEAL